MNLKRESDLQEIDRLAGLYMGDVGRKHQENMRAFAIACIAQDRRDRQTPTEKDVPFSSGGEIP